MSLNMLDRMAEAEFEKFSLSNESLEGSLVASCGTPPEPRNSYFNKWNGWSQSVGLADLLARRAPPIFLTPGMNIYRITYPSVSRPSIGMTVSQSIFKRIRQHASGKRSGDRKIFDVIRNHLGNNNIRVQAAQFRGNRPRGRLGHMYEIWLQWREQDRFWSQIQHTRTFEDERGTKQ